MSELKSFHIQTKVNGFYLIQKSKNINFSPLLIGFHGYGETADDQMRLLQNIPGIGKWTLCSLRALHPFYNTKGEIGYSWMTSDEREIRIKENVAYINSVIGEIKNIYQISTNIVFHGFSQGTAMACRAALLGKFKSAGVILLGGDIPPEFEKIDLMQRILIARGQKDKFYSSVRWKKDISKVRQSKIESHICEFNGGHSGHADYYNAVGDFLKYYE